MHSPGQHLTDKQQSKRPPLFVNVPKASQFAGIVIEDEDEKDVQIIIVPPGKAFYLSSSFSGVPITPPFVEPMAFACSALEDTFKSAAQILHEELERILQPDDRTIVFNAECLQEVEMGFLVSPVEDLGELCIDSMQTSSYYSPMSPPTTLVVRALPDVPGDLESEFSDEEVGGGPEDMDEDLGDDDDSSDEAITPLNRAVFGAPPDKHQVASLAIGEEFHDWYSVSPSNPLLSGFFS